MTKYIKRQVYIEHIMPFIGKSLIKVIVGQRRVGKSFFIFQLIDFIKSKNEHATIVYINKEDLAFDNIKNYKDLVAYAETERGDAPYAYLFVDEIQEIELFEKALRHLQSKSIWDIYCTGSNANLLSGELSTYLSGRYIELEMYGLSYAEFLIFHNLKENAKAFANYIKFGGLPYLCNLQLKEAIIYDYLKNIYAAILFKDVVARYNIRNVSFLERLTAFVADNIGQILSAKSITDFLKSQKIKFNNSTVLDYLGYLTNAFFIYKIKRNDLKGKRLLEIGEKYYFGDVGIRHALTGYKTNDISQVLENLVFLHLKMKKYNVSVGKLGNKEIDFVCEKNNFKIYIQVTLSLASEAVKNREYGNLLAIKDNHRKIVITADEYQTENVAGIETWNIRKFLLEF